ncbi:MAG: MBL fold metallo-hydrolase [Candidatus Zixiibacteriota bacterium]|nr:MAG: MBL fold metallo-hydrolase [candidate division Zixibacteria bacterium]
MADKFTLTLPGDPEVQEPGSIFFVGTATTLIRHRGFTILTDPNFIHAGDHVHLGYGITVPRLTNPAIDIEALPLLDFCVLSHYHGDHWDQVASDKLDKNLPIFSTAHAVRALKLKGFRRLYPLNTWERAVLRRGPERLSLTAMPGKHGPGFLDVALPPVMGSLLEWGEGADRFRLYITGDTLLIDQLQEIPRRFPDIDLMLIHLGGTRLAGVLLTMDAEQGIRAVHLIAPRNVIPIHYNDYPVFKSPLEDFLREVRRAGWESRVHVLRHGDTFTFDRLAREAAAPVAEFSER